MSFLDDAIAAAKQGALVKLANPRAVQTAEQSQVTTNQSVGFSTAAPSAASATKATVSADGIINKIPGGKTTLLAIAGVLGGYLVLKKLKVI